MTHAELLVAVLTAFSIVVVALTRWRLRATRSPWLFVHTWLGLVGAVVWVGFLIAKPSSHVGGSLAGVIGLGCWWAVSVAGIALASSARSGGGRRVAQVRRSSGRWSALLIHVLVLAAWLVNTWAYAVRKV